MKISDDEREYLANLFNGMAANGENELRIMREIVEMLAEYLRSDADYKADNSDEPYILQACARRLERGGIAALLDYVKKVFV